MPPPLRPPSDYFLARTGMARHAGGGDDYAGFGSDRVGYSHTRLLPTENVVSSMSYYQRSLLDEQAVLQTSLPQVEDLTEQLTALQLSSIRVGEHARRLELPSFRNGAGGQNSGASSFTPVCDYVRHYRSMSASPAYSYSSYPSTPSPGFQSGGHHRSGCCYQQNRTGMSTNLNSSMNVDSSVGMNNESFWPNGHNRTGVPSSQPFSLPHLRNLQNSIATLACHPIKSKSLQLKIEQGLDEEEIKILFWEIFQNLPVLMVHEYANRVVQQLVDVCNEQQMNCILGYLTTGRMPLFLTACFDPYGHLVIQRLLANASTPCSRRLLLRIIAPEVANLVRHLNGHHVVLYCLRNLSNEDNEILYTELERNCYDISTDKNGCRAIQTCIDCSSGEQRTLLLNAILDLALPMCSNNYGNYVVQKVLSLQVPGFAAALISKLEGQFSLLSCDKYASNVVESCLRESGEEQFNRILGELLGNPNYMIVFLHEYGNYVFKSAVEVAKLKRYSSIFCKLQAVIQANAKLMNTDYHGKKAVKELKKGRMLLPETDAALRRL